LARSTQSDFMLVFSLERGSKNF